MSFYGTSSTVAQFNLAFTNLNFYIYKNSVLYKTISATNNDSISFVYSFNETVNGSQIATGSNFIPQLFFNFKPEPSTTGVNDIYTIYLGSTITYTPTYTTGTIPLTKGGIDIY